MRKINKSTAKYAPQSKNLATPAIKATSNAQSVSPANLRVKAVYFGLEERILKNITASVIEQCVHSNEPNDVWTMPADDVARAIIFGDPIPFIVKKVYVRMEHLVDGSISEQIISSEEACVFRCVDGILSLDNYNSAV
jgi:hypothetical protein